MRTVSEFIKSRIFRLGFLSVDDFLTKNPDAIKKPTLYRILRDGWDDAQTKTKELIAGALGFREWADLMKAYEADDVTWGLVPTDTVDRTPKKPPGRPTLPGRPSVLQVELTPDLQRQITMMANREGRTIEEMSAVLVAEALQRRPSVPPLRNAARSARAVTDRPIAKREKIDPDTGKPRK